MQITDTAQADNEPDDDIIWNDPPAPDARGHRYRRIPLTELAALRHPAVTRLISGGLVPVAAFNSSI